MNLENIISQIDLLKTLGNCKNKLRKSIIVKSNRKLVQAICELIDNTLRGNLKFLKFDYNNLKKYKHTFRKLLKKSNLKTKKKILIQHGGFLPILIPSIIGGLSTIISSLVSK